MRSKSRARSTSPCSISAECTIASCGGSWAYRMYVHTHGPQPHAWDSTDFSNLDHTADFRHANRPEHTATVVLVAWCPHPLSNRLSPPELLAGSLAAVCAV